VRWPLQYLGEKKKTVCAALQVALLESLSPAAFPLEVLLGTATGSVATPQLWMDPVSTVVSSQP
jgi:hypothetical protein